MSNYDQEIVNQLKKVNEHLELVVSCQVAILKILSVVHQKNESVDWKKVDGEVIALSEHVLDMQEKLKAKQC